MSLEFLWYIPNQVAARPPRRRRRHDHNSLDTLTEPRQGARGARLGRCADRHRLGPARHVHRRRRAGRPDDDVRAADRDPARLLAARQLRLRRRHPGPPHRRPGPGQHRLGQGQPGGLRRQRGRPGPPLRPHQGVHAARPPAVDRGERHLRGEHFRRHRLHRRAARPRSAATARIPGSTSAAPPRPPSGWPPPRPTSSCSGASRWTASASGSSGCGR